MTLGWFSSQAAISDEEIVVPPTDSVSYSVFPPLYFLVIFLVEL
jgi:hypothetical protein